MPPRSRNNNNNNKKRSIAQVAEDAAKKIKSFEIAKDADVVLGPCRKLRAKLALALRQQDEQDEKTTSGATTATAAATATANTDIVEVSELSSSQVMDGMEAIALQIATQVLAKQGFQMEIPSRAASNQVYIAEWDRIVLGNKTGTRSFLNVKVQYDMVSVCLLSAAVSCLHTCYLLLSI